ncbi:tyrosine-protein kinase domain-containing protein [Lichenifustis flavocetrariae]|uniref:Wzz/FepE/Etk N-terminal domain-containing protein n=1 Tax=Lichenifustis flavocetrariae TaxID=2949735 RepID=A0AA42CKB2_9HYPH|nr:tyrosine-protein kinase domain-containing protein [Lichenifustis flavocetrariae]MCW6509046.1 Wzz/FepE/Etk N-terminal domain-containing protein [Lichenifustis flavocetrariae]
MNYMDQAGHERLREAAADDAIFSSKARITLPEHDPALVSIGEMLQVLRRGKWIVLACLGVCLGVAGVYLYRTPPEYSASSQVILEPRRLTSQEAAAGISAALDSAQAESQMQVVKSERILSIVFDTLDLLHAPEFVHREPGLRQRLTDALSKFLPALKPSGGQQSKPDEERLIAFEAFSNRVSVRRIGQSYVLEISYRALSPAQAARLTNSITAAYIHSQIEQKVAAARRGAEFLEDRFAVLRQEEQTAADAIRDGAIPAMPFPDSDARVISAAREPLGKSYPQNAIVLVFAAAVGLLIGCGILAVRQSLDRRVRTASQIWRHFGLPCLSVLPVTKRRGRNRVPFDLVVCDAKAPFSQALRSAYTSIVTAGARQTTFRALGVVSWRTGEGKSTIAGNLAHFIAATGEKAVLIDADLQDPALSEVLAPEATAGLCEALGDHADLIALKPETLRRDLGFVPARSRFEPYRPNLFLGAPQVGRFINHLRDSGDVIVDLPAMVRSPHAQAICGFLDAVVLVVECGQTTIDEVAMAVRTLESAQAQLVGIVLNKGANRHGR